MRKFVMLSALAAASLFCSCAKENLKAEDDGRPQGRVVEISARMENTKVSVATDGKVTWAEKDTVAVFNTDGRKFEFGLVEGAGTAQGTFRCESFTGTLGKVALYPSSYAGDAEGSVVYPDVRYYDAAESVPVVMAASLSGSPASFVQLGGVIELNMFDIPAYARAMLVKSGSFGISGTYTFDTTNPAPVSAAAGHPASVEIRFPVKTGYGVNTKFHIPVPVGNYDDLFVQFLDGDEDVIEGTEFIKIPDKYGAVKARDYVSMARMDVRSKVTRSGYVKVEGVKWATGNLRAWKEGADGTGWQSGWNVYDKQYESAYQHITETITGASTGGSPVASGTEEHFDHFNYGGLGRTSRVQNSVYMCPATAKEDIAGRIFDVSAKDGDAAALTAAEKTGDARFVGTADSTFSSNMKSICGDIAFWASKGQVRLPRSSEIAKLRAGFSATSAYANCQAGYYMDGTKKLNGLLFTSTASWESSTLNKTAVELTDADLESGLFLPKVGLSYDDADYETGLEAKSVNGWMCYGTSTFGSFKAGFEDCLTILGARVGNDIDYGYTINNGGYNWGRNKIVRNIRPVIYNPSDEIKTPKSAPNENSLAPWKKGQLDIHFINVGLGECNFVIMPDGTSIVIDAGECADKEDYYVPRKPSDDTSDPNYCRVYKAYTTYMKYFLQNTRHNYIDYALATHYHIDHIGTPLSSFKKSASGAYVCTGFSAIYEDLPIKKLVDRNGPGVGYDDFSHVEGDCTESVYNNYIAFAGEKQSEDGMSWYKVNSSSSGRDAQFKLKYDSSYDASFKVIGYNFKYWNGSGFTSLTDTGAENGRSVTTLLTYGDFNCYFGADCHANYSTGIMTRICENVGKVEALKAPHHMAVNSLTTTQTSILQPKVTVVEALRVNVPNAAATAAAAAYGDVFATNNEAGTSLKDYGGHFCIRVTDNAGTKTFMVYKLKDTDFSYEVLASYGPYSCH